jgi:hypothetical protein
MQFYLPGITPLFWKQVDGLPAGVYNKDPEQTASAAIEQLFVTFVDLPMGTTLYLLINGTQVASALVVDSTGLTYARVPLPYTAGQDSLELQLKDSTGLTVQSGIVATSHIAFFYETAAEGLAQTWTDIQQLEQDTNIQQVDENLLYGKYGVYTGLGKRFDQSSDDYRDQTACLWQAYQGAATVKGLENAIHCVVGGTISVVITPTRTTIGNRIFQLPQFENAPPLPAPPTSIVRLDTDLPHWYFAHLPAKYRLAYDDTSVSEDDWTPRKKLLQGLPTGPLVNASWDDTTVKPFSMRTVNALGSEIVVRIGTIATDATILISTEVLTRQEFAITPTDKMGNEYVATAVTIEEVVFGGVLTPTPAWIEDTDYSIDRLTGEITWLTGNRPDDRTQYKISYRFRLDESLKIVANKVKPGHCKVVMVFAIATPRLPLAVIA